MIRRFPFILSLMVIVSILLTACGSGAPAATQAPASDDIPTTTAS